MISKIIAFVRQVMYRMGLIKGIKNLSEHKDIAADEEHYKRIDMWYALYRGYYEEWHKVAYHTINGPQTRRMHTLNMPKIVAEEMARLVFNERCQINISDEGLAENLEGVFKRNSFYKQFQDYLEYNFALGGMVSKTFAAKDRTGATVLRIGFVTADCFLPISWTNGHINEGVFVNQTKKGDKWYTLLEWHQWEGSTYVVTNELYESTTATEIGVKVSLSKLYPDLEEEVRIENLSRPLFVYFKPNIANNFDTQSPLGISIYANALDTMKALDIAFDSFIREFRLGKKRILVPATAVKTVVDPQTGDVHRYFDANDEVYQAFNFTEMENQKPIDISVEIRVEEHAQAIQTLLDILAMQIGFSAGTFTFDGQGVKTATEVVSENSKTFRTKNSHETLVEEGLKELITSIVEVAELYGIFSAPAEYEVNIDFDDSIAEDRDSNADYYLKLKNGGLLSAKTALMRILDYTEEQAEEELKRIAEESRQMTGIDVDLFGMNVSDE
ncbi:phage portal protein, A118 family [Caldalkalibacillus thermarum TA2.A1]|uniref:Phage portal protein n=1 Tax=Caldalkalibacillus thermarum (strain TA2.A1) TaxID=986075 RepID=F5L9F4_CALTT|nr:phage portal protein [Caldalkalibacillus thermarum]EGL82096.1 phage portal protein, A118 family [Caldalkalibacillus thermarum TA2.A1]QZT33994.1 phage portal protein [Caldalkalibacillus thermarum TA2.A1]